MILFCPMYFCAICGGKHCYKRQYLMLVLEAIRLFGIVGTLIKHLFLLSRMTKLAVPLSSVEFISVSAACCT